MASGGGGVSTPLLQDFFVKDIGKLYAYEFLALSLKFYLLTFEKFFKLPAFLGSNF